MKLPFMKFFPRDWMGDERLRLCSLAARGLWIDMLCLMHSTNRRGFLVTATDLPLPLDQLARLTGCSTDEVNSLLTELKNAGVYDCSDDGTIQNRRMVKEERKREKCALAGKEGGGNPRLTDVTYKGPPKGDSKGTPKPEKRLRSSEAQTVPSEPLPDEPAMVRKRKPCPLFDAIAEVTGSDPKATGAHIGRVRKALLSAEPPYSPDEVREFGRLAWKLCKWSDGRRPTLGEIEKYIGLLRNGTVYAPQPDPTQSAAMRDLILNPPNAAPMTFKPKVTTP